MPVTHTFNHFRMLRAQDPPVWKSDVTPPASCFCWSSAWSVEGKKRTARGGGKRDSKACAELSPMPLYSLVSVWILPTWTVLPTFPLWFVRLYVSRNLIKDFETAPGTKRITHSLFCCSCHHRLLWNKQALQRCIMDSTVKPFLFRNLRQACSKAGHTILDIWFFYNEY